MALAGLQQAIIRHYVSDGWRGLSFRFPLNCCIKQAADYREAVLAGDSVWAWSEIQGVFYRVGMPPVSDQNRRWRYRRQLLNVY